MTTAQCLALDLFHLLGVVIALGMGAWLLWLLLSALIVGARK